MSTHSSLSSLFTDIADAIRSKTGSSDGIVANDFPEAIEDVYDAAKVGTASAADVRSGKTFTNSSSVGISGSMANSTTGTTSTGTLVATKTPGTSVQYVNISAGYTAARYWAISAISTQTKSTTAGTAVTTVNADSGKYMTAVTVNPTPSETKTATSSTAVQTITPTSGKLMSSVTINAISTETKSVTATTAVQTVSPTSGKVLTSVTVNPQVHSGTYNVTNKYNETVDLTAQHNYRYLKVRGYYFVFADATNGGTATIKMTSPFNGSGSLQNYTYYKVPAGFYVTQIIAAAWHYSMNSVISFSGKRIYCRIDASTWSPTLTTSTTGQTTWTSTNYGWYRGTYASSYLYPNSTAYFPDGSTTNQKVRLIVAGQYK